MKKKLAIIGAGNVATRSYLPYLVKRDDVELVIQSRNFEKAKAAAETFHGRAVETLEEVAKENLTDHVTVTQTGCIGICQYEPVVEVFEAGKEKVTYVKMTAEKAKRVVEEHLKGGKPVSEYTIGNN